MTIERMASGNLRISEVSPRPFSQVGTDEKTQDMVCIGRIFLAGHFFGLG
jgi:hypothetical protein